MTWIVSCDREQGEMVFETVEDARAFVKARAIVLFERGYRYPILLMGRGIPANEFADDVVEPTFGATMMRPENTNDFYYYGIREVS
jgi:hypothetical protein